MEEFQDTEDAEAFNLEESSTFTDLRKADKAKGKEIKRLQAIVDEVEAANQTRQSETVQEIMNVLGLPGLSDDVLGWIEGDATQENVVEALKTRDIPLPEGAAQPEVVEEVKTPSASNVGQQVADAAAGVDGRSLEERINATENQEELNELMTEAGLARSHF